jgi:hypothetical protein
VWQEAWSLENLRLILESPATNAKVVAASLRASRKPVFTSLHKREVRFYRAGRMRVGVRRGYEASMESRGRLLLEENPQMIAAVARKTGATEGEARALLLLERLGEVFD